MSRKKKARKREAVAERDLCEPVALALPHPWGSARATGSQRSRSATASRLRAFFLRLMGHGRGAGRCAVARVIALFLKVYMLAPLGSASFHDQGVAPRGPSGKLSIS